MTFEDWMTKQFAKDCIAGLRVGQSYMNHVRPNENCPELFYEIDPERCWYLIMEKER